MVLPKIHKAYMWCLQKHFKIIALIISTLAINNIVYSQTVIKEFKKDSIRFYLKDTLTVSNKKIPPEYNNTIKLALIYYPELCSTKIKFKTKSQASPLSARPSLFSIFQKAKNRKYIICISTKTMQRFDSILLKNLTFNSQVGVIGHELSHIVFYNKQYGIYFIKLFFMHLNKKAIDKFEYNTDMRCIEHGLGYQLLLWSKEVRLKLNLTQWKGINKNDINGRERYMNPESIIKTIQQLKIYQ